MAIHQTGSEVWFGHWALRSSELPEPVWEMQQVKGFLGKQDGQLQLLKGDGVWPAVMASAGQRVAVKPFGGRWFCVHPRAASPLEASECPVPAARGQVRALAERPLLSLAECRGDGVLHRAAVVIFRRLMCWVSKHTTQKKAPDGKSLIELERIKAFSAEESEGCGAGFQDLGIAVPPTARSPRRQLSCRAGW